MNLRDTGKHIADVCLDAIAQADEQALDLDVSGLIFLVIVKDEDGYPHTYTGSWFDG